MSDPYQTPESDVAVDEVEQVIQQLKRQQSYILAIIVSLVCSYTLLAYFSVYIGRMPLFIFVCPGFLAGFAVKIVARPYRLLARIIPSLICASLTLLYFWGTELQHYGVVLAGFNFFICLALSRRLLNYKQETALYRIRNKL